MIYKVVKKITTLTSLALREEKTDYRKIEFLKMAFKDEKWALKAYGRVSEDADFEEAVTSIKAGLSDIVKLKREKKHDTEESSFIAPALYANKNNVAPPKQKIFNIEQENCSLAGSQPKINAEKIARNQEEIKKSKSIEW